MGISPTRLTWVQDAYTLVFGGLAAAWRPRWRHRRTPPDVVIGLFAAILAPSSLTPLTATSPDGRQPDRAVPAPERQQ